MHNLLSTYTICIYIQIALECLNIVVGIKVTDRSFETILDTLNNLTELILYARNDLKNIYTYKHIQHKT